MTPNDEPPALPLRTAAKTLRIPETTLYSAAMAGKVDHYKIPGMGQGQRMVIVNGRLERYAVRYWQQKRLHSVADRQRGAAMEKLQAMQERVEAQFTQHDD